MSRWSSPGQRDPDEIAAILKHRAQKSVDYMRDLAARDNDRTCPICGYRGRFSPHKHKPDILCPNCDSRPRHRLLKLWMDRQMQLPAGARVVHFAAEAWVRAEFDRRGAAYQTADINEKFELRLDLTAMDLPNESYDMLLANHVLEHVDDEAAFAEIFRVLKPGGQAVITVPMIEGFDHTYEDPSLTTPALRQRHYGDADHRRWYGRDIRERFARPGFKMTEFTALEPDAARYALHRGEKIFIGTKP